MENLDHGFEEKKKNVYECFACTYVCVTCTCMLLTEAGRGHRVP